ncbi:protein SPIRAL1-like 2 isoform X2 [Syzygium oleosum]|nr:protein SPIRAL1-like 2 isoform X2 [Syzygium oleosum]
MGRGVSSGGGQSSLGYLFGSGEAPKAAASSHQTAPTEVDNPPPSKPVAVSPPVDPTKQIPAGIHSTSSNNYLRADGQNTGNFLTHGFIQSIDDPSYTCRIDPRPRSTLHLGVDHLWITFSVVEVSESGQAFAHVS